MATEELFCHRQLNLWAYVWLFYTIFCFYFDRKVSEDPGRYVKPRATLQGGVCEEWSSGL